MKVKGINGKTVNVNRYQKNVRKALISLSIESTIFQQCLFEECLTGLHKILCSIILCKQRSRFDLNTPLRQPHYSTVPLISSGPAEKAAGVKLSHTWWFSLSLSFRPLSEIKNKAEVLINIASFLLCANSSSCYIETINNLQTQKQDGSITNS